jgi:hypothetical protein
MIECVFTLDYEVYGDGTGSMEQLVHAPAERLMGLFDNLGVKLVVFAEAAELMQIEANGTDPAIGAVRGQLRKFHEEGYEIGLHLHPQWCGAQYRDGTWLLDNREYNLCTLERDRIRQIVARAIGYLRDVVADARFQPLSFRAGNWLFQPCQPVAGVLAEAGIRVESSVFKGGRQRYRRLDYRPSARNGYYWTFGNDVNVPDSDGALLELPIHTQMVPFWKLLTAKRVGLQNRGALACRSRQQRLCRFLDLLRPFYPLKLDFCRMTLPELVDMTDTIVREDRVTPVTYKPIVAIGHTKDLVDCETVDAYLRYLKAKGIGVTTFGSVLDRCTRGIE